MIQWYSRTLLLLLFADFSYSQKTQNPAAENELDFDDQKVVMLGPPRDGFQRAVFDEVSMNNINESPVEDITQTKSDIDAYDDKFVELPEENPLFIPKAYRNETTESSKGKQKTVPVGRSGSGTAITTQQPFTTFGRGTPAEAVGRTFAPVNLPTRQLIHPQPPFRPPVHPFPQPPRSPPRLVAQQQFPTQQFFRFVTVPHQPRFVQQFLPPRFNQPVPQRPAETQAPPPQPIRPYPQTTHLPHRISPLPFLQPSPESLRTGVCRASIFYISTPIEGPSRHSFSHFANTVSADQCARTCHEFNCAIAHYDPSSGRCQFNPSTAFAIREGQCPPWPATHYKNNIRASTPLRIFCVQCHRPIRKGHARNRGNRFRTTPLRTHFTGRIPNSLQGNAFERAHSVLLAQPDVITKSSFQDVSSLIAQQKKSVVESSRQRATKQNNHSRQIYSRERVIRLGNDSQDMVFSEKKSHVVEKGYGESGTSDHRKIELGDSMRPSSRTKHLKRKRLLRRGNGVSSSNVTIDKSVAVKN